ncbi:acyl carrier protein [Streptomyces sp. 4N509B]|uniref:acyl carrier protein n=1 Tax=Streptomyces sp. 4N509B TaxID=3457413 RepID=UPI003FCF2870
MEMTVSSRFVEMFAEKAGIPAERLDLDATFEDLGMDSLHLMEIALWVQKEFDVTIPEGDLEHDQTAREALDYLTGRVRRA